MPRAIASWQNPIQGSGWGGSERKRLMDKDLEGEAKLTSPAFTLPETNRF